MADEQMTSDDFPKTTQGKIIELAKLLSAISILVGFAVSTWAFTWGPVRDAIEQWGEMQASIASLKDDMRAMQGEDRVIRETPGFTYVSEPVYQGEPITYNFNAQRTTLGSRCRLLSTQPIFTDMINAPTPGTMTPANIQLTTTPTQVRPEFAVPANIRPGRVTVYLILEYDCDGRNVRDQTSIAAFELLRGSRPD